MSEESKSQSLRNVLRNKTCLIVDDDELYCKLAASSVRRAMGHAVICHDGVDALRYLERKQADVAVIDLVMPQIDGFRLIALLRHMPATKRLPIIVVTAQSDEAVKEEARRMDISRFLTKPVNWSTFVDELHDVITEATQVPDIMAVARRSA